MNYKDLNAIIIKNRHLLSFIIKTLNCLYDVKRFIKLNFKKRLLSHLNKKKQ